MSSPVETVMFIDGSLHGKTLPIGCGVQLMQHGSELYRRQGESRLFYLSSEVLRGKVEELQRENV